MKRPHISDRVRVNVAIAQAKCGGIVCPLCHTLLVAKEPRVLEHMVPHELGGTSNESNLRWVHDDCAKTKTNGRKPTVADGDIHKIAKAKRLLKKHSNPTPEGTMKSRGFQGSRAFNGKIKWRAK